MTPNGPGKDVYARRRAAVLARLEGAVLFLPARVEAVYSSDVHYRYRQDTNVRYLSGFEEPAALMLCGNTGAGASSCHDDAAGFSLFVRPRDAKSETWSGRRVGTEGALAEYGADHSHPLEDAFVVLQRCLEAAERLYVAYSRDPATNQRVLDAVHAVNLQRPRKGLAALVVTEAGELLDEMRLFKEPDEVELMRTACRLSGDAHTRLMEALRPGMFEYQAEALLDFTMRNGGCRGPAYGTIVAGGANATVLHYTSNQRCLRGDELVLVDAGGEYGGYCADITRTLPVGSNYDSAQAELYDLTLAAQEAAIATIEAGTTLEEVHEAAVAVLVQGLIDLGIVDGPLEECLANRSYEPYYMHRTSHWLGMDVHDVGRYRLDGKPRPLEPGMVLTVEPGIYIREDADVAPKYRGIGIRIEDDVVVTSTGHEVLSAALPKKRADIERIRKQAL